MSTNNLASIRMLVLDVDGVLTDGSIQLHHDGTESKSFSILDGHGIRMWRRAGMKIAFLSGRFSEPTSRRAQQLEVDYCFQECHYKLDTLHEIIRQSGIPAEQIAYIGDDLMDIPVVRQVGFGIAVASAVDELKTYADYITTRPGGRGAVREAIEYILKSTGKWEPLMKRYLEPGNDKSRGG